MDLATLSACETGGGRLSRGEGLIGLARAFRLAGARDLWRVDDAATADFMEAFHARLARGQPVSAALRATRLEFMGGGSAPAGSERAGFGFGVDGTWANVTQIGFNGRLGLYARLAGRSALFGHIGQVIARNTDDDTPGTNTWWSNHHEGSVGVAFDF